MVVPVNQLIKYDLMALAIKLDMLGYVDDCMIRQADQYGGIIGCVRALVERDIAITCTLDSVRFAEAVALMYVGCRDCESFDTEQLKASWTAALDSLNAQGRPFDELYLVDVAYDLALHYVITLSK